MLRLQSPFLQPSQSEKASQVAWEGGGRGVGGLEEQGPGSDVVAAVTARCPEVALGAAQVTGLAALQPADRPRSAWPTLLEARLDPGTPPT